MTILVNQKQTLSLKEASEITGYHQDYLGQLCRSGKLRATKIKKGWVTTQAALDEWLGQQSVVVPESVPAVAKPVEPQPIQRTIVPPITAPKEILVKNVSPEVKSTHFPKVLASALVVCAIVAFGMTQYKPSVNNYSANVSSEKTGRVLGESTQTSWWQKVANFFTGALDSTPSTYTIYVPTPVEIEKSEVVMSEDIPQSTDTIVNNYYQTEATSSNLEQQVADAITEYINSGKIPLIQGPVGPVGPQGERGPRSPYSVTNITLPDNYSALTIGALTGDDATFTDDVTIGDDLTVSGTLTAAGISGTINPELTTGSVTFQGASGLAQDNSNFFWDDTRDSLGIGTATPQALVSLGGSSDVGTGNITSSSGTSVTGTGTAFTTQLKVGDVIVVNGQPRTVATIVSDTSLTTTTAFSPALTTTPSVSYVNTATTNTGSTESNTLIWSHYVDSTVENGLLIVAIATHKNTALAIPTVASVTYGSQTMTQLGSQSGTNTGVVYYRLVAPEEGTHQITVTLSSSATARMVGQSILMANVNQATPFGNNSSGGGSADTAGGAGFGPSTKYGVVSILSFNANITADLDEDGSITGSGPSVELASLSTGSTTDDVRLLVGFTHLSTLLFPGFYQGFTYWELSGSTNYVVISPTIINSATATGAFVYRSSFLSVKDSVSYEQIKIAGDGQASFHNGISVDLVGSYGYNTYAALFNGGFVGIGTTAPTNELSVTGDADFSGTLGVAGGAVDPNIGINIESSGAYGGDGVNRYGVSADLTTTDLSNVIGGNFQTSSSYGTVGADHNILTGVDAGTNFYGAGRLDNAIGVDIQVANTSTGNMKDAYGIYNQILSTSGQTSGVAIGYYSDIATSSSVGPIASASAFLGKIRKIGGTSGFGTIYGIQLSGWEPGADTDGVAGAPFDYAINTSYGIYMDNSIDVGDTRYALYSSSTSQSYLQGALGIADTTPDASLEVVNDGSGDSFLVADTNDGDATPFVIQADGDVGIGTASPSTKLEIGSVDLGDGLAGPVITLGRNTNATNTGAGSINFQSKAGTAGYVWQDNAGNIRVHTSAPSNANDTAGVVVGDQTSTRESKQDFADYTTYQDALQMVLAAPLHTFRYKKDVSGYGEDSILAKTRIGYIADEVPGEFMWGNSIDQVSVNGLLMASVKALEEQITQLKTENQNTNSNVLIIPQQLYLSQDNVGQAKILANNTKVRISFKEQYESQPIVTVTPMDFVNSPYRVTEVDASGFTIEFQLAQTEDVIFSWHSFGGPESKLTVSDGTTEDITLLLPEPPAENLPAITELTSENTYVQNPSNVLVVEDGKEVVEPLPTITEVVEVAPTTDTTENTTEPAPKIVPSLNARVDTSTDTAEVVE